MSPPASASKTSTTRGAKCRSLAHVAIVQGRAHRGHHLTDAHLVSHQHVGVALDDGQIAGLPGGMPGLIESVKLFALGE